MLACSCLFTRCSRRSSSCLMISSLMPSLVSLVCVATGSLWQLGQVHDHMLLQMTLCRCLWSRAVRKGEQPILRDCRGHQLVQCWQAQVGASMVFCIVSVFEANTINCMRRHMPEIEQGLTEAAGAPVHVSFTPHLINMSRCVTCACFSCATGSWAHFQER